MYSGIFRMPADFRFYIAQTKIWSPLINLFLPPVLFCPRDQRDPRSQINSAPAALTSLFLISDIKGSSFPVRSATVGIASYPRDETKRGLLIRRVLSQEDASRLCDFYHDRGTTRFSFRFPFGLVAVPTECLGFLFHFISISVS